MNWYDHLALWQCKHVFYHMNVTQNWTNKTTFHQTLITQHPPSRSQFCLIMARIENKIVKSTNSYEFKLPRDVLKKNLATIVFEQMKLNEKLDNIAIVNARNRTKDSRLSCDLENLSKSLARSLKYNGFKRGDVIQVRLRNCVSVYVNSLQYVCQWLRDCTCNGWVVALMTSFYASNVFLIMHNEKLRYCAYK